MDKAKYVLFRRNHQGPPAMVIFPPWLPHIEIAKCINAEPWSAGFVDLTNKKCYGESVGLRLKPGVHDDHILKQLFKENLNNEIQTKKD